MNINMQDFMSAVKLLGLGMLGIFAVMIVIALIVAFMVNFKKIKDKLIGKK